MEFDPVLDSKDQSEREGFSMERSLSQGDLCLITAEIVPVPFCYVDSKECYRFTNKAYEEWVGRSRKELRGERIDKILDTSVYQAIRHKIEVVLSGQEVSFKTTVPHKDGGERYVHATYLPHLSAQREVKGFVAQVIDITGHKRAEEALREREAKNQALLDAIPDLMFLIDKHGTYLDFKAARDIEPLMPPSEFLGKTVYEVLSSGVAERTMHYLQRALETGEIQNFEYQLLMQGNMRHYEARGMSRPLLKMDG